MIRKKTNWRHTPACTEHECVCADTDDPDPMCDCGRPGWACNCEVLEALDYSQIELRILRGTTQ